MHKCPNCNTEFEGFICPKCDTVSSETAANVAKKKKLTPKQIALIVLGIAVLGVFSGIFTALTRDPSGYDQLDGYQWEDKVEQSLKSLGVEKINNVSNSALTFRDGVVYDLKIETDKTALLIDLDDNNDVIQVVDNESGNIYLANDTTDKDSQGRLLKNVYDYATGEVKEPADEQAIADKQEAERKAAEEKQAEEERQKQEEAEQAKHTVSDSQQVQLRIWAEDAVLAQLKAPSTAEFAPISDWTYGRDENHFQVTGYVDAQNGFGAMIRSNFVVDFQWDGESETAQILNVNIS